MPVVDTRFAWADCAPPTTEEDARALLVANAACMADLGAEERWDGRRDAYREAILRDEPEGVRAWFGPVEVPAPIRGKWLLSSCGLVRRALEASLGVGNGLHHPVYVDGTAMAACQAFARKCGAWRVPADFFELAPGDALWRADKQHVATVVSVASGDAPGVLAVVTVEGGQAGGIGEGTEIAYRHRVLRRSASGAVLVGTAGNPAPGWPLLGWTDLAKLRGGRGARRAMRAGAPGIPGESVPTLVPPPAA